MLSPGPAFRSGACSAGGAGGEKVRSRGARLMSNSCQLYLILSTELPPSRPRGARSSDLGPLSCLFTGLPSAGNVPQALPVSRKQTAAPEP